MISYRDKDFGIHDLNRAIHDLNFNNTCDQGLETLDVLQLTSLCVFISFLSLWLLRTYGCNPRMSVEGVAQMIKYAICAVVNATHVSLPLSPLLDCEKIKLRHLDSLRPIGCTEMV